VCGQNNKMAKASSKDAYPLPSIDCLVDGVSEHKLLSFLDTYSCYNQISIHSRDKLKMMFITDDANYFYEVMSFRLKKGLLLFKLASIKKRSCHKSVIQQLLASSNVSCEQANNMTIKTEKDMV